MSRLQLLVSDLVGLGRICGWSLAARWFAAVIANAGAILRSGNLKAADAALGAGPFEVRHPAARYPFRICGPGAISGIREMYVRDAYLRGGALEIRDGDVIVDLGANMGNFTNLALAHGPEVRVIAVEPNARLNAAFERSVGQNGWRDRVDLVSVFLGADNIDPVVRASPDEYKEAELIREEDFLKRAKLERVDFLKCDIEGGEFALLREDSRLLDIAERVAIEVHSFGGDVDTFLGTLKHHGFRVADIKQDPNGTCTVLAKKSA